MKNIMVDKANNRQLYRKILVLATVMVVIIVAVSIGYIISFSKTSPKISTKQGAVSYLDVDKTEDVCTVLDSRQNQQDCLDEIDFKTGELADLVNNL